MQLHNAVPNKYSIVVGMVTMLVTATYVGMCMVNCVKPPCMLWF